MIPSKCCECPQEQMATHPPEDIDKHTTVTTPHLPTLNVASLFLHLDSFPHLNTL